MVNGNVGLLPFIVLIQLHTSTGRNTNNAHHGHVDRSQWRPVYRQEVSHFEQSTHERYPVRPHHYVEHPSYPEWNFQNKMSIPTLKSCDGRQNLADDLGLASFGIGLFATFFGFGLDMLLTFKSQFVTVLTTAFSFIWGVPSELLTILNWSDPISYLLGNAFNMLGISNVFLSSLGIEIGNLGLLTDVVFTIVGVVTTTMSVLSTWPHLFDGVVRTGYNWGIGEDVRHFIENYGCYVPTPYSP